TADTIDKLTLDVEALPRPLCAGSCIASEPNGLRSTSVPESGAKRGRVGSLVFLPITLERDRPVRSPQNFRMGKGDRCSLVRTKATFDNRGQPGPDLAILDCVQFDRPIGQLRYSDHSDHRPCRL